MNHGIVLRYGDRLPIGAVAQQGLASHEGIFCEPASAASLAILQKLVGEGRIEKGVSVVCVLTGNGLKDLDVVEARAPLTIEGTTTALMKAIGV